MDIQLLADVIKWINEIFGVAIPEKFAAGLIAVPFLAFAVYLTIKRMALHARRSFHNSKALDTDGRIVVDHIRDEIERLQAELHAAVKEHSATDLQPLLTMLSQRIDEAQRLADDGDEGGDNGPEIDRWGRIRRRQMVRLIRETVLSNLWSGNYFSEMHKRRHVFRTIVPDAAGEEIAIIIRTPFADLRDDELGYGLDVRHGRKTVLRMQWEPHKPEDIKIAYCFRGSWEDVILSWNVSDVYKPVPDELEATPISKPEISKQPDEKQVVA